MYRIKSFIQYIQEDLNISDLKKQVANIPIKELLHNEKVKNIYNKIIDEIKSNSYEENVDFINSIVKDSKLKNILKLGFDDNEYESLNFNLNLLSIPAKQLQPTQKEIGIDGCLKYTLLGDGILQSYNESGAAINKTPIVTFNKKYVIDGHHRWSQMLINNNDANILAYNISCEKDLSAKKIITILQMTVACDTGAVITNEKEGENLFKSSISKIIDYIKTTKISKKCIDNFKKVGVINNHSLSKVELLDGFTKEESVVVNHIIKGCEYIKDNCRPAYRRTYKKSYASSR